MKLPRSRNGTWTVERDRYVIEAYPKNVPMAEMIAAINAMPGFTVNGAQVQDRAAKRLKVYRGGGGGPPLHGPPQKEARWNSVPPAEPLKPLPVMTRDRFFSAAWRDSQVPEEAVPVTLEDVRLWASQHCKSALGAEDMLAAVNLARSGEFGLPPFRIVKTMPGRLPPAWFGAGSRRPNEEKSPPRDNGD